MPTGKIRAPEISDFSRTNEIIKCAQGFFDGCDGIETVQLKQVNVIGAEPFKGTFHGTDQIKARGGALLQPDSATKCRLGGNKHLVTPTGDGFAKNFLRQSSRINVSAIEHIQAGFKAYVHETRGFRHAAVSPRGKEFAFAAKRAGTEGQHRDFESRTTKLSIFHIIFVVGFKNGPDATPYDCIICGLCAIFLP